MPSGESLADSKPAPKAPLKRAIALLSPLLIVSVGLHGLAMLLPLPEQAEIAEEELELPEPIQVSDLPELDIPEPESAPAPAFVPAPAPEAPPPAPIPPSPIVQPPIVAIQPPEPENPLVLTPQKPPKPEVFDPSPQELEENQALNGPQTSELVGSNSIVRTYNKEEAASRSYSDPFLTDLAAGAFSDEPISYEPLGKGTLTFTLPAGDNCFKEAKAVGSGVMLPTSLGVVVSNDGDRGFIRYVTVVKSTGYAEANDLINNAMLSEENEAVYNAVDAWLRKTVDNGEFPFAQKGDDIAYIIFSVEAIFEGHSCPAPSSQSSSQ